ASLRTRATIASHDRLLKVAATGTFVSWLAATSVDWIYDIPGPTGMGMVAAALLVIPVQARHGLVRWRVPVAVASAAVLALLAASIGRQFVGRLYADAGARSVERAPRSALSKLRQAQQIDPYSLNTLYSIASAFARL